MSKIIQSNTQIARTSDHETFDARSAFDVSMKILTTDHQQKKDHVCKSKTIIVPPNSLCAITIPIQEIELKSYYLIVDDSLMGIEHYIRNFEIKDDDKNYVEVLIKNNVNALRKIIICWF